MNENIDLTNMKTTIKCKVCGSEEDLTHWSNAKALERNCLCQHCNHWHEQHDMDQNVRGKYGYAIIDGGHYVLCSPTNSYFKGFGGHKFTIQFNDGYIAECNNLWFQGKIPEGYWRELMPDNAKFLI